MNLVDTSGWIEYFFGNPNASFFAPAIEDTGKLIVPVICLYEVFKKVNLVGDPARALQAVAQMKQGKVVPVTEEMALRAATISMRHKLPMADSLVYSAAQMEGALLWTQDEHFVRLEGVRYREARSSL